MSFDPVAYINTPRWQASRLGLARIARLLELMGRPQDRLRFVHVAGTNGKGSTCAYLESILRVAGYRTGLFTSPYIEAFEERIRVNGENISGADLADVTLFVKEHAERIEAETGDHPTEFELMTAVAFEHFARSGCDIVVLEVGLGGRLDSTNVIDAPEACVIARVGLDHTALLGDTVAQVAAEKAGIVKAGVPVISWPQEPEAMRVLEGVAAEKGCELSVPDFGALEVVPLGASSAGAAAVAGSSAVFDGAAAEDVSRETFVRKFSYGECEYTTRLLGSYQPANAALAMETARVLRKRGWDVPEEAVYEGVASAEWPGRFEVVACDPLTIVDGGHNPQGAQVLADSLQELVSAGVGVSAGASDSAPAPGVVFVMGVLADKDYAPMVDAVLPFARAFFTYAPENPRSLSAEDLAAEILMRAKGRAAANGALSDEACGGSAEASRMARVGQADRAEGAAVHDGLFAEACGSPAEALRAARAAAGEGGLVVAFGSLYSIAGLKAALRQNA